MIRWTEQAAEQLERLYEYIALSNSENAAVQVTERIIDNIERLTTFPLSGRSGRVQGTRELPIPNTPFLVVYTIHKEAIVILAVYHGAQQWPKAF